MSQGSPLRPYSPPGAGKNANETDISVASVTDASSTTYTTPADSLASSLTSLSLGHAYLLGSFHPKVEVPTLKISATLTYSGSSGRIQASIVPLSDDKKPLVQQLELLQKFVMWKKSPVRLKSDMTYEQYVEILDNEVPQVLWVGTDWCIRQWKQ